jgi:hypothetical protein
VVDGDPEEEAEVAADLCHQGEEGVEVVLLAFDHLGREVEVDYARAIVAGLKEKYIGFSCF